MKFGVLQFFSWPGRRFPLEQVYERAFNRIKLMDETGYDAVWLAEHHFSTYSVCPSVHMMGTHVAAHTKNIRIGTAISLASFYHPLRLAEEVALLDQLTHGRVNWGAGRGFDAKEHEAFGVAPQDSYPKFRESVEVVLKAWKDGPFSHKGEYFEYNDIEVLPKPYQKEIPVWMAASSDDSIEWAAKAGHSILLGPHASHVESRGKFELYKSTLEGAGHVYGDREIPVTRSVGIGETDEDGMALGRRGAEFMFGNYLKNQSNIRGGSQLAAEGKTQVNDAVLAAEREKVDPIERYINEVALCGSPEKVIDDIERLRETNGIDYLMIAPLGHESFIRFTEKVMPHFQ
jgi:alkanesulfonate monooxygenase SsuD/methylene tetrahydromethanopterin reductase-like flavin-dependent oxidoreductase (luciferase family)